MSTPTSAPTPSTSLTTASPGAAARPASPASANDDLRREVHAALVGRQELGPEYDPHFADALVERLNVEIQREVDRQLGASKTRVANTARRHLSPEQRLGLAIPSLIFLIPLIAIAGHFAGLTGMLIALAAVVALNIAADLA